jgi:hypothetical protein
MAVGHNQGQRFRPRKITCRRLRERASNALPGLPIDPTVDYRFEAMDHKFEAKFEAMNHQLEATKHELVALFRGELLTTVTTQTRTLVLANLSAVLSTAILAFGAAKLG